MKKITNILGIVFITIISGSYIAQANAGAILLYDDFQFSSNPWNDALTGLGHSVTSISDDASFTTSLSSGSWDLVVAQFDSTTHPSAATSLSSYVGLGGNAIFSHWRTEADTAFDVTQANTNLNTLTLSMFSDGLSSSVLALTNPTYGIFSRSFVADAGSIVAASFEDGNAGIVIGNNGRTIINGFLGETLGYTDEVRLYQNQVSYLINPQAIPEPGTLVLFGLGLVGLGYSLRKRKA